MKSNKIDLLIVNPGNRTQIYQDLGSSLSAIENPIWSGLIATYVRNKNFSVNILDANALGLPHEQTANKAQSLNPTLVAIVAYGHNPSASTQVMPSVRSICTEIKKINPKQKIILLGGHIAALPLQSLQEEETDYVALGEGLKTLPELISHLQSGTPSLSEIPGLGFLNNGKPISNPMVSLVENLDKELPTQAWDLLPMNLYRAHNWHCFGGRKRQPYAAIYTTLGCPYHCSFCCIQAPFRSNENDKPKANSYRFWSADTIISQINLLVSNYGVKNIKIADEMFVLDHDHVSNICDKLIAQNHDLNIWAYARVDTVKDDLIPKLKKAGFRWLAFGIEAADSDVRRDVKKGFNQERILDTIQKVQSAGIHVIGNYIFGLPKDNIDTMRQTYELSKKANTEFANFYCTMAYPGSELYQIALSKGWKLPTSWLGYSQHSTETFPLRTEFVSEKDVLSFRDESFHNYFSRSEYKKMMENSFGPDSLKEIEEMTNKKIHRNLLSTP